MGVACHAFRACRWTKPRGEAEDVALDIISELYAKHGESIATMTDGELLKAAGNVCKMLGKRESAQAARFDAIELPTPANPHASMEHEGVTEIAVEAHEEREKEADTRDMLNTEAIRLGITTEEPTKRRRRIKRGSVAEKIQSEEADALEAVVMRMLETPAPRVRRRRKSDFHRVEPDPPLWDAASTEPGLLQLGQEDAAKTDRHGRVVPFVPEDGAWWKLLIGGETKGKMGGVTHEPATWPKLHTCVLAFAMRPEDIRELAGAENLLGGGRGGCRIHPKGLQRLAEDFLKTLEHLEPAFDADGNKDSWRRKAKTLLTRLVRILEKV
jgi:hypothetical protein